MSTNFLNMSINSRPQVSLENRSTHVFEFLQYVNQLMSTISLENQSNNVNQPKSSNFLKCHPTQSLNPFNWAYLILAILWSWTKILSESSDFGVELLNDKLIGYSKYPKKDLEVYCTQFEILIWLTKMCNKHTWRWRSSQTKQPLHAVSSTESPATPAYHVWSTKY